MSPLYEADDDDGWLADINTTPLVDVMLVLLIVFMVTMPAMTDALKVELPRSAPTPPDAPAERVVLVIEPDGRMQVDGAPVDPAALAQRMARAAAAKPGAELHIAADRSVAFERVTDAMQAARDAGLEKIGFVTQPRP